MKNIFTYLQIVHYEEKERGINNNKPDIFQIEQNCAKRGTKQSSREMGVHVEREKRRYTIERCALKCKPKATLVLEINA
ncbi:hypothetical protein T12_10789 [Trichinella patagoniensis]|uniref:Uncharacterized protein n=1 Tax=Trichinella patagoniensis TaxID=990121 RepID=A0A0V1AEY2_9BILA|nr:hypothetical protein T12_10789 [Trichinella patagoniensis]